MRNKLTAAALLLAVTALSAGCGGVKEPKGAAPPVAGAPASNGQSQLAAGPLAFEVVAEAALPAELSGWKELQGARVEMPQRRVGNDVYVLVSGGAQPTGGYAVAVKRVSLADPSSGIIEVQAVVTAPETGTVVSQAVTYPRSYVRISYPSTAPVPKVEVSVDLPQQPAKSAEPSKPAASVPTQPATPPVQAQKVTVEAVDAARLPAELAQWRSANAETPGGTAAYVGEELFIMVSGGERPSGGFRVEIAAAEVRDGTVRVEAILHKPAPGAMVTMALTYPKAYARALVKGTGSPKVEVIWK